MPVKYDLVQHDDAFHDDHWAIKILEGDLEGVVYQYDTVTFREDDDGVGFLDFDVLWIEGEEIAAFRDYEKITGEILAGIIEENVREMTDGDRDTNTETPAE
jgi:hypothetical protein